MPEEKRKSLGAIWVKETKNGDEFLSISLKIDDEDFSFVAFRNSYKTTEKHPDFKIFPSQLTENQQKLNKTPVQESDSDAGAPPPSDDDIPLSEINDYGHGLTAVEESDLPF